MVSKSMAPQATPGSPQEINLPQWSAAPANAAMVAFGALSAANGRLVVYGWLDDTRNTASPQVLGKQYNEAASQDMARTVAHRFADEIISRLGGGINGIAETKIYFVSSRTGTKEIWAMDYDGQNQHQITHLGSVSLSPRISPDNSRVAFSSLGPERLGRSGCTRWILAAWSLPCRVGGGTNIILQHGLRTEPKSPSPRRDPGDPEIWVADAERRKSAQDHGVPRTRRLAHLEPAHQFADRMGQRPHRPAADLHHGSGRRQHRSA